MIRAELAARWATANASLMIVACVLVLREDRPIDEVPEIAEADALLDAVESCALRDEDIEPMLRRAEVLIGALRRAILNDDEHEPHGAELAS